MTDRESILKIVREVVAEIAVEEARGTKGPERPLLALGADHGGFPLKEQLRRFASEELGWKTLDLGTDSEEAVDYPDFALAVARAVASGKAARGVLVDGAGIGSTMAANKVRGVRAALCHDARTARNAREHNDANVLVLGAGSVGRGLSRQILRIFLTTPFAGGRHERRVQKIMAIEEGNDGGRPAATRS